MAILARAAAAAAADAYLVGGAIRDSLLGRSLTDIDVAVSDARAFAQSAARRLGTRAVLLDERRGVYRLPLADGVLDVVQMAASLDADLARRDFTIDALAFPLSRLPAAGLSAIDRSAIVDRAGGLADLDAGVVRVTAPAVLDDDPLRVLRAVRLAAELDFSLAPATAAELPARVPALERVAPERIGVELHRLFSSPRAARAVRLLEETTALAFCFPALEAGRGMEQRPHHRYPVFEHQLAALDWVNLLIADEEPPDAPRSELWLGFWGPLADVAAEIRPHLQNNAAPLRLAALLHDVGKPATLTLEPDGSTRFFGHASIGADMAVDALRRWRFSGALIDRVALLIREHLRPGQVAAPGEPPTDRALHRFHRALGDVVPDLCLLFLADSLATAGVDRLLPRWPAYVAHVRRIVTWEPPPEAAMLARLVDGHAVMEATDLPPGPVIGRILRAVQEAAAAGEVRDRPAALALAVTLAGDPEFVRGNAHG